MKQIFRDRNPAGFYTLGKVEVELQILGRTRRRKGG
jgi:hypothetical protein